jgi:hypothetical protein
MAGRLGGLKRELLTGRTLRQRRSHVEQSPARFAVSLCSAQNLSLRGWLLINVITKFLRASSPGL